MDKIMQEQARGATEQNEPQQMKNGDNCLTNFACNYNTITPEWTLLWDMLMDPQHGYVGLVRVTGQNVPMSAWRFNMCPSIIYPLVATFAN